MLAPEFAAKLKNGTDVIVRTINACDKECLSTEFDNLSHQSRYSRFCMAIDKLSERQLAYLADVDNENHVLITITQSCEEPRSGLGLGRYIKLADSDDMAEFSITVTDQHQNQGVGSLLLELLIKHARDNSVKILRGSVLQSNKPMLRLLQRFNFKHSGTEDGLVLYDLVLNA